MMMSTAVVVTDSPSRYAKQLLSHLGHKVTVEPLADQPAPAGRLVFAYGTGTVVPQGGALVLEAAAADAESLARVKDVMQRHLEKFGARRELLVSWGPEGDGATRAAESAPAESAAAESAPAESAAAESPTAGAATPTASLVTVVHTDAAPSHTGPVPQAVEAGGWIYVSALFGADPVGHAIPQDTRAEAEQVFSNLAAILAAAGAALTNVVRVGIVMRDLQRDRPVFNSVWAERFGDHRPARSAIESPAFGRPGENARFMIEVTAYRG
jgi:enamine deaminase RidA (YjgF/YER057c/UK114 family)